MAALRFRTLAGVAWTSFARVAYGVIQFGTTVLLVRSLLPEDYGLLGMAAVFLGFASLIADLGFNSALVQRREIDEVHASSVFWLQSVVGVFLMALFFLGAPAIAGFYHTPELAPVVRLLSLSSLLGALGLVPTALLQRRMAFDRLAWVEILSTLISGVIAIGMAFQGFGVWSLVAQFLLLSLTRSLLAFHFARWLPRGAFSGAAIRQLAGYSANLLAFNVMSYWSRNADSLLIGRLIGTSGLGIYTRAFALLAPSSHLIGVITNVIFPTLAAMQGDPERVARTYLRVVSVVALLTFPLVLGLLVVAGDLVYFLFGQQWLAVAPVLQVLCLGYLVRTLHGPLGWLYTSQGRTDWMLRWGSLSTAITVLIVYLGALQGTVIAVAWAYVAAQFLLLYPSVTIAGRIVGMRFADVMRAISGVFACSAAMAALTWGLGAVLPVEWSRALRFAIQLAFAAGLYAALVAYLDLAGYRDLRELLRENRARRRVREPTPL